MERTRENQFTQKHSENVQMLAKTKLKYNFGYFFFLTTFCCWRVETFYTLTQAVSIEPALKQFESANHIQFSRRKKNAIKKYISIYFVCGIFLL